MKKCLKCLHPIGTGEGHYGLHNDCFCEWFDFKIPVEFVNIIRRDMGSAQYSNEDNDEWKSSFFQGKFRKYSASLLDRNYIIKVQQSIAPELPDVEFLCNQIAEVLGLPIPEFFLIEYYGKRSFVSRNFLDGSDVPTNLVHIYHYLNKTDEYDCKTLLSIIEEKTTNISDIELFIQICLYDALIGNHDRHGRNIGLITKEENQYISPIYDNTSAMGLETGDFLKAIFSPRGKISTSTTNEPTIKDYILEFKNLGYENIVNDFANRVDIYAIWKLIENSHCSRLMKKAIVSLTRNRFKEMNDAL